MICHHRASCQLLPTRVRSSTRPASKSLAGREHPATRWEEQQSQRSLPSTTAASPSIHGTSCNFPTSHSDANPALGGQRFFWAGALEPKPGASQEDPESFFRSNLKFDSCFSLWKVARLLAVANSAFATRLPTIIPLRDVSGSKVLHLPFKV